MIETFRGIWRFAGKEQRNIRRSVIACFFNAVFHMFEIAAIYYTILALLDGKTGSATAWQALGLLAVSILGSAVTKYFSQLQQTHAGYFMAANKRVAIGQRMKSVPMGYFNDNSLGELTGVCTTVLDNVETVAPMVLVTMLGGMLNALVFTVMILIFDWRIGLIVVAATAVYLFITSAMEQKSAALAPHRQKSEAKLVEAVLEYVQGMSVVKSFNLTGRGDRTLQEALEYNCRSNLNIEKMFTPYIMAQGIALQLGSVAMMLAAVWFYLSGTMILANALMVVIMSFLVFAQISSAGSGMSLLRIVSSCMAHADETDAMPQLAETGRAGTPREHSITFDHVSFSYDQRPILRDVSFAIPDRTTTAIVGPSGSGKTTLCNLIARFWDVESGTVLVGGQNVKDYTLEDLMDQISMVFQKVYLFADTVENNIKFGCPNATHEEVVAAAKKACCHDFIMRLPQGYDTMVGEGGCTLSGGEKQRISIARAMLKDAQVILLDEATASLDPENEVEVQKAIDSLIKGRTVIAIAHRLKTIKDADRIIVLEDGRIKEEGTHDELIRKEGLYAHLWNIQESISGWKL